MITSRALRLDADVWGALAARLGAEGRVLLWVGENDPDLPPDLGLRRASGSRAASGGASWRFALESLRAEPMSHDPRHREPEGRSRQDHHRHQPRRRPRRPGAPRPAGGLRSAGQRHPRPRRQGRRAPPLPCPDPARSPLAEAIRPSGFPNLDLVPSQRDLVGVEVEFVGETGWEERLKGSSPRSPDRYDTILLDCPPSLGHLTVSALDRGGRRPRPAPVRVLRPRRDQRADVDRPARPGSLNPQPRHRRHPAHHVRRPHQPLEGRGRGDPLATSATRSSRRSCRATSASPRPRATACRSSSTTSSRAAPRPTWRSRASSCGGRRDRPAAKKRGLGRGLDALIEKSRRPNAGRSRPPPARRPACAPTASSRAPTSTRRPSRSSRSRSAPRASSSRWW